MYNVSKIIHEKYGNVIHITREEFGEYNTPFDALYKAIKLRRLWLEEGAINIRFLVDMQIMILKQIESWANQEYKELPKCEECAKILGENVFTHKYCKTNLFCSQLCSDKNFDFHISKYDDEIDCDYLG